MQLEMYQPEFLDLSKKKVLIGISGGINSAGLLCYLATEYPVQLRPKEVHLFAVQLKEHSPDTFDFMKDCIRYAARKFDCVRWKVKWGSVLRFFEGQNMIPHPILSPCSDHLKIIPMREYIAANDIDLDLIGYVQTERNRIKRQLKRADNKYHPIAHLADQDCFDIVDREIGWHPAIYDIREWRGKNLVRVFKHNNCLPCKNFQGKMTTNEATLDYQSVAIYYPEYHQEAQKTAQTIGSYWGRDDAGDFGECPMCDLM